MTQTATQTTTEANTAPKQGEKVCCGCSETERSAFVDWVGRLVREHRLHLLRVARREGLGPDDAFDVVQEGFQAFLTLPAARMLVDVHDDSRKLLTVVTRNLARNRRRMAAVAWPHDSRAAVLSSLPADTPSVDELLASAEDVVRLRGCVRSLGDVQRAVVTLRMLDEVDGQNVARTLRISTAHVAVLLHRAKANLLSCMTSSNEKPAGGA